MGSRQRTTAIDTRAGADMAHRIASKFLAMDSLAPIPDQGEFERRVLAALPDDVRRGEREPTPDDELVAFTDALTSHRIQAYLAFDVAQDTATVSGRASVLREERARSDLLEQLVNQRDLVRRLAGRKS